MPHHEGRLMKKSHTRRYPGPMGDLREELERDFCRNRFHQSCWANGNPMGRVSSTSLRMKVHMLIS